MKYLSLIILGASLMTTGLVFSQQIQKKPCACKDCRCAMQSHCGCSSDKGCDCKPDGKSCCSTNCGNS